MGDKLLALLLMLSACGKPMVSSDQREFELTPGSIPAEIMLASGTGRRATIAVQSIENRDKLSVTILAETDGPEGRIDRFALYPPDRPAKFRIRIPEGATRLKVYAESDPVQTGAPTPMKIIVSIAPGSK